MPYAEPLFPEDARQVLVRNDENYQSYELILNGDVIGTRCISDDEAWETQWSGGQRHGVERYVSAKGIITYETRYVNGTEHGTARQFSEKGELIGIYEMNYGTGMDLWRCNLTFTLAEQRGRRRGTMHGFERWWNSDQRTVWDEAHYQDSAAHGIFREWNRRGRLCRGSPRYFIAGERVDRRRYLKACKTDASLPPWRPEENRPDRPLPEAYLQQVAQGIGPRRCIQCRAIIGELFATSCPHCAAAT